MKHQTLSKIYAYVLIALVGWLILQYFMPVLKIAGVVEGMGNYQNYEGEQSDPMFLARKNASNISYLKDQLGSFSEIQKKIDELSVKVEENSKNIVQLVEANSKKADAMNASAKKNLGK